MIDIETIYKEVEGLPIATQVGLQGATENDNWKSCVGKVKDLKHPEQEYTIPIFDIPYINSMMEKYKMFRTRLLTLDPLRCYSYHQDPTYRVHIPIHTNHHSWLLIDGQTHQLKTGYAYLVNTKLEHTAINASNEPRSHIVGCVSDSDNDLWDDFTLLVRPVQIL